jgi:hypothetical protein
MSRLSERTRQLEAELAEARASIPVIPPGPPLAGFDDPIAVVVDFTRQGESHRTSIEITWSGLFKLFSPKLINNPLDSSMKNYIACQLLEANNIRSAINQLLSEQSLATVRVQYQLLGLIKVAHSDHYGQLQWSLTDRGKAVMLELNAVRKK